MIAATIDAEVLTAPVRSPAEVEPAAMLIDREGFARLLDVSVTSLHRLKAAGKLPAPIRLGGSVRWDRAEVRAWLLTRGPGGGLLDGRRWAAVRDSVLRQGRSATAV